MTLRQTFADNVKLFRKNKKLTQAQLAEKCDLATNYLSEIEKGKKFPSVEVIEKIAIELEIKPYILFFDESDTKSQNNAMQIKFKDTEKQKISSEIYDAVVKIFEKY